MRANEDATDRWSSGERYGRRAFIVDMYSDSGVHRLGVKPFHQSGAPAN
jgi:hypothetical protein